MRIGYLKYILFFISVLFFTSCRDGNLTDITFSPTKYVVEESETEFLGPLPIPPDNELTHEGIKLGQHLFFDPILSGDNTMSCGSCHDPQKAFTDGLALSPGIDGVFGRRSSMSLVNSAYYTKGLFWDGRSTTLEEQALLPVEDEIELHDDWDGVEEELRASEIYPKMFREAFGIEDTEEITRDLAAKALSQFQRIILSGNSKFDKVVVKGVGAFSDEEYFGLETFFDVNPLLQDGECGHCHNDPLFTTNQYFDNGLQVADSYSEYKDIGLGQVTGNQFDYGKFRAPTLRNIALTAPYMHDGRFNTLEEVIDHYDSGGHATPNKDGLIYPLSLTDQQKEGLIAFLHTLTDTSFLENPYLTNPFE